MRNQTMFKKFGSVLALIGILSFMTATVAPRRADAAIGLIASAPVTIVTGAVMLGVGIGGSALLAKYADAYTAAYLIVLGGAPLIMAGVLVLPADLSSQYRFPELNTAPQGVSESELADYLRDRAVLEVLAQDVRTEVARDIVSDSEWKSMSRSEQVSWAQGRSEAASRVWGEYVSEGLISENSLKVLAAISR